MNKSNAHLYLPLVQALADGKVIQVKSGDQWQDLSFANFNVPPELYRIKPEPREWWVCVGCFGQVAGVHDNKHTADHWAAAHTGLNVVNVREVLPQ